MKPLIDAIIAKFATEGLAASITGGLWHAQAPDSPLRAMPFAVVSVISAPRLTGFGAEAIQSTDVTVQFSVFDRSMATVLTLCQSLMTAYDDDTLTLSSGTNTGVTRLTGAIPSMPERDGRDDVAGPVYGCHVDYVYTIQ